MPVYDTPITTQDQSLDRVLSAGLPVVLILFDGRQGPLAQLDDALRKTAKQEVGKLLVARIDVADNPQAAQRLQGASAPAALLVQGGEVVFGPEPVKSDNLDALVDYVLDRGTAPKAASTSAGKSGNGSGSALTKPVIVTDASFQQEVLSSAVPVVVDFWAAWCGPCRMIAPTLEKLAAEYGGRVKIAKVNVDENQRYAGQYGVQSIPTLLVVKDGQIVDRLVGALPEQALRQRIAPHVN